MGREKYSECRKYFVWSSEDKKFKCVVEGCQGYGFTKDHIGNFTRHIASHHPDIAQVCLLGQHANHIS